MSQTLMVDCTATQYTKASFDNCTATQYTKASFDNIICWQVFELHFTFDLYLHSCKVKTLNLYLQAKDFGNGELLRDMLLQNRHSEIDYHYCKGNIPPDDFTYKSIHFSEKAKKFWDWLGLNLNEQINTPADKGRFRISM